MAESRDEQVTSRRSAAADVQQIKEQIASTRDRMAATIDAIQYRLDPVHAVKGEMAARPDTPRLGFTDRTIRRARIAIRVARFAIAVFAIVRAGSNSRRRAKLLTPSGHRAPHGLG